MDEASRRAERRASSQKRTRLWLGIGGGILIVAVIAVVVALVAGGGGGSGGGGGRAQPGSTTRAPNTNVSIPVGNVSASSAGPPAQLTPDQSLAVMKAIGDYVTTATVDPLRSAKPAGDLSTIFDAGSLARVTGPDRAVMLDEGLPKVTGDLNVVGQPVTIVALADQSGAIVLATAELDLDITGVTTSKAGPLHIIRRGDLVLVPDPSGAWKVTSYNIAVARAGAGIDVTTTTAAPATPVTTHKGSK